MSFIPKQELTVTAFGDLNVAEMSPIMQYSFEYTVDNTELSTNVVTNGGTVTQANSMAVVGTSTTTNSTACLTSRRHIRYRSGQGGVIRFTALFTAGVAATEQYMGFLDEVGSSAAFKNGYVIGFDGTTFGFHRFSNDSKTSVALSAWDDPLDGTGVSGMTIDNTKLNVWQIQFQWLGAGAITLSVEDDATGLFTEVHKILYSNLNTEPSTHNPNFLITLWSNNKATTSDLVIKSSSFAGFVEGKTNLIQMHQPQFSTDEQSTGSVTTELAVVTIRNKATYASKTNFIDVIIEDLVGSIEANSANNLGRLILTRDATLGGSPSYSDVNTSDSVVDIDTAGTTVTGGKILLVVPLAGKNDSFRDNLLSFKIILQPGETLTVSAVSANSATINANILWKELF